MGFDQPELLVDAARNLGEQIGCLRIAIVAASLMASRVDSPNAASAPETAKTWSFSLAIPNG
jgi:hypothetical protein